jgi:hypothetical protein
MRKTRRLQSRSTFGNADLLGFAGTIGSAGGRQICGIQAYGKNLLCIPSSEQSFFGVQDQVLSSANAKALRRASSAVKESRTLKGKLPLFEVDRFQTQLPVCEQDWLKLGSSTHGTRTSLTLMFHQG